MVELPSFPIDMTTARSPGEKTARTALLVAAIPGLIMVLALIAVTMGVVLAYFLIGMAVSYISHLFVLAHIRTNGVRVSADQYPDLDSAAENFANRLGLRRPEVYVMPSNMVNAFAAKLAGQHVVVLLSPIVDLMDHAGRQSDLLFVLGHEFGHIAAGHFSKYQYFLMLGYWMPFFSLWHRRHMELTCDRIGLLCAGSAERAIRGMSALAVGGTFVNAFNAEAAVRQYRAHKNEFIVGVATFFSLYPPNLWRIEEILQASSELGIPSTTPEPEVMQTRAA